MAPASVQAMARVAGAREAAGAPRGSDDKARVRQIVEELNRTRELLEEFAEYIVGLRGEEVDEAVEEFMDEHDLEGGYCYPRAWDTICLIAIDGIHLHALVDENGEVVDAWVIERDE